MKVLVITTKGVGVSRVISFEGETQLHKFMYRNMNYLKPQGIEDDTGDSKYFIHASYNFPGCSIHKNIATTPWYTAKMLLDNWSIEIDYSEDPQCDYTLIYKVKEIEEMK